jgi:hypothetical protein
LAWHGNAAPSVEENILPKHTGRGAYPINFKYGIISGEENPPFTAPESTPSSAPSEGSFVESASSYIIMSIWVSIGVIVAWIL